MELKITNNSSIVIELKKEKKVKKKRVRKTELQKAKEESSRLCSVIDEKVALIQSLKAELLKCGQDRNIFREEFGKLFKMYLDQIGTGKTFFPEYMVKHFTTIFNKVEKFELMRWL